jgi:two-component system, sensor histidine kinase PdtaS
MPKSGLKKTLRQKAEEIVTPVPAEPAELSGDEARALIHELQVHQVELEMQNEELRRAQNEIEESRSKYFELYDFAPVGYFTFNGEGIITEANLYGAGLLGVERLFLTGKPFALYMAPECKDAFHIYLRSIFKGHEPGSKEFQLAARDGREYYVTINTVLKKEKEPPECHAAVTDITERRKLEEQVKISLEEKEVLMREIHHRVKNNLQLVSSLLSIQERQSGEPGLRRALQQSRDRVRSIGRIYEMLSMSGNLTSVDCGRYITSLADELSATYSRPGIVLTITSDEISMDMNRAVPVALIVNEIATNAFKHAFPGGRAGRVDIEISTSPGNLVTLAIRDDGIGHQEEHDDVNQASLGMQIVEGLVSQLKGTMKRDRATEQGTHISVTFKN